ncbi:MAG TPA: hypothetical protein PLB38_03955 [bacterium]|nr:hypothetical protein [bacterium]
MLKKIIGKLFGGFLGKEIKTRVNGKDNEYSLSFEDTTLPWKEMTNLGDWAIFGDSDDNSDNIEFGWDKKFMSSNFDGKTSAIILVGVFNFNYLTVKSLVKHLQEGEKSNLRELENTEMTLEMLRFGKLFQERVKNGENIDGVLKKVEDPMDVFFKSFWPVENENTRRVSLKSYHENFYGLESWAKISNGIKGDKWIYNLFIPAGGIIYFIRSMVLFENLKDAVKNEIEQIAHSFRFDLVPIAIDDFSKKVDEDESGES